MLLGELKENSSVALLISTCIHNFFYYKQGLSSKNQILTQKLTSDFNKSTGVRAEWVRATKLTFRAQPGHGVGVTVVWAGLPFIVIG